MASASGTSTTSPSCFQVCSPMVAPPVAFWSFTMGSLEQGCSVGRLALGVLLLGVLALAGAADPGAGAVGDRIRRRQFVALVAVRSAGGDGRLGPGGDALGHLGFPLPLAHALLTLAGTRGVDPRVRLVVIVTSRALFHAGIDGPAPARAQ